MRNLLALALVLAAPATGEVVRLSPAERDAVIAAAANGPERSAVLTPEATPRSSIMDRSLYPEFYGDGPAVRDRKVHGEVSVFAGSGGTFGVSGTAIVPVGENGTAAVSVLQGTSNRGGLQGFSLGYASGGAQYGPGFAGGLDSFNRGYQFGLGGGFDGPGVWGSPYGPAQNAGPGSRRRR